MRLSNLSAPLVAIVLAFAVGCGGGGGGSPGGGSGGGTAGGSGGGSGGGTGGGTGGGSGGGSGTTGTAATFCDSFFAALATLTSQCYGGSVANWEANVFTTQPNCSELQDAVNAGRVTYNSAQSSACISAVQATPCSGYFLSEAAPASCNTTLTGTVAVGGNCFSSDDCAGTSTYCKIPSGCQGTCANQIAVGQACNGGGCVTGSTCFNQVCTANSSPPTQVGQGQACGYVQAQMQTVDCSQGFVCDSTTNLCVTLVHQGGTCTPGHSVCEYFTSCSAATNTCVPWPSTAGAACGAATNQDYVNCMGGFTCNVTSGTTGTCIAVTPSSCTQD
jgi:hypothetical protein